MSSSFYTRIFAAFCLCSLWACTDPVRSSARKHCSCAAPLLEQSRRQAPPGELLNEYNEMVHCLGGEATWLELRLGKQEDHAQKLSQKMQEKCPEVLELFRQLGMAR